MLRIFILQNLGIGHYNQAEFSISQFIAPIFQLNEEGLVSSY